MKSLLSSQNVSQHDMGFKHMLSTCLTIILTEIWRLAATLTCVGTLRWSQVTILYHNHSTPGQTKAHAVLYSSQECVHNSCPHANILFSYNEAEKKGIPFYNVALL